ncbi:MAG: hypothetical protein LQ349_002264 [Xanthoria aureola]|nr:MAG: hypothetical protein LQ349_002264 [Xanthoria aureola]
MDPPPKRRKFFQRAQGTFEGVLRFSEHPITHTMAPNNKDPLGKQLPLRAAMAQSRWTLCATTRKDAAPQGQERHKPHRLHPRQLDINGAAAPVQTTVASYIDVVLDSDGTSIGNVLVPAESTVFSVDGYGPITLDNYNPPNPTPASSRPTSRPHGRSHAAQQTMQPESQETQQGSPNAAASPSSPTPMTIQVPGSSSQAILSSPPTPLPPNPSSSTNSSSSLTASESYFGSTSSQTSSAPDTASPQTTGTAFAPQGNSTTSFATSSQTVSGSTLVTTFPVTFTPTSNSTSYSSSFSDTLLTTSSSLNQTSATSTPAASTNSRSTTSSLPFSTSASSTSSSSPSASSTFSDTGVAGGGGGSPTGTGSGNPSSSTTAASGSGGGGTPSTPTLVGSVVGGLAGLALILILILFLLRRRKQLGRRRTISPPIPQSASTGPGATSGTMTERSSAAVPLASAAFFRRLRPGSGATATTTETTPSERGFQNLGGRKLESVLSSRGDGYGDVPFGAAGTSAASGPSTARGQPPPSIPIVTGAPGAVPGHSSPESLSGSSFYRDSQGFYGGPGQGQAGPEPASNSSSMFVGPASPPQSPTHPPSSMPQGQEGVAVMRPGPARTPLTTQGGLSPMRGPPARGTPPPHIPGTIQERPRDGLGRSHPSMDGSRGSRFAENI